MELLSFVIMIAVPLAFVAWGMTKRDLMSVIAVPFLIILFYSVMQLNSDPVLTMPQKDLGCGVIVYNSTTIVNTTSYNSSLNCQHYTTDQTYTISPQALTTINYSMMFGELTMFFVIFMRAMKVIKKKGKQQEDQ